MRLTSVRQWAVGLGLLTLAGLIVLTVFLQQKLPQRSDQLTLAHLSQPVVVSFDEWGIPHINASTELDGYQALGFVHAQDRLFQMDLLRRVGKGELSALIGEKGLSVDKLFRTLGTPSHARDMAKQLRQREPQTVAKVEAYYRGVNQAIEQLPQPLEYDLLGAAPEPFALDDAYAIAAFMAHSFMSGLTVDPMLTAISQTVSPQLFDALVMGWPESKDTALADGARVEAKTQAQQKTQAALERTEPIKQQQLLAMIDAGENIVAGLPYGLVHGSNGWAISAEKSAGDFPLFANDPHMAFSVPAVWYEAQLTTPQMNIYGHFAAGIPFPLLMRNDYRTHGLTMLQSDDADVFALQADPADVDRVLVEGQWQRLVTRTETIHVKGQASVEFDVKVSSAGPLVNEVLGLDETQPMAFYWLFTRPENDLVSMMSKVTMANSVAAVEAAVSQHWSPGLNVIYADKGNNIAMWAVGRYIHRQAGQDGKLIVDASVPNSLPLGVRPFSDNPRIINPESGYLFSTNNPYPGSDPDSVHTGYYSPIYREQVAEQALSNAEQWTPDDMKALQTGTHNARWGNVRAPLLAALENAQGLSSQAQQARAELQQWDGRYAPESVAASIFERFYFHLLQGVFADELGAELFAKFLNNPIADNTLFTLVARPQAAWWDNVSSPEKEVASDVMRAAFSASVASLSEQQGGSVDQWAWLNAAGLTHPHPLGKVWPLDKLFNVGDFAVHGSKRSLNNMIHKFTDGRAVITNGPSTRRVVDLADIENGWNVNPVGQSGRLFDDHYRNQSELYNQNQYRRARLLSPDDTEHLVSRLTLLPSRL